MSETKWSPGPWKLYSEDLRGGKYWSVVTAHDFESIDIHEDENGEANARLISAAPELYEALLDALAGLQYVRQHYYDERTGTGDLYGVGFDRVEQKAKAAIAKAIGDVN
jgi:hypothetical protein